jgi:hypothetical protein
MRTETNIEAVFENKGSKFVVEYELTFDYVEFYVDVTRIESFSSAFLDESVVLQALKVAQEHGRQWWAGYVADAMES